MTEYMSREGYEKARERLEQLKRQREEISEEIGRARGFGDISENAEYDAAKEKQALVEKQIADLESRLSRVQVLDDAEVPTDKALLGAAVTIRDEETDVEMTYTLVSELESDPDAGKISISSPVGKALLGRGEGEVVRVELPRGVREFRIVKIERR